MDKRGIAEHVDWIVALGIFFVYLTIILTFFKPGVNPMVNPDTLLNIVEDNLRQDVFWTVSKTPLFIYSVQYYLCTEDDPPVCICTGPLSGESKDIQLTDLFPNLPFLDSDSHEKTKIFSVTNEEVGIDVDGRTDILSEIWGILILMPEEVNIEFAINDLPLGELIRPNIIDFSVESNNLIFKTIINPPTVDTCDDTFDSSDIFKGVQCSALGVTPPTTPTEINKDIYTIIQSKEKLNNYPLDSDYIYPNPTEFITANLLETNLCEINDIVCDSNNIIFDTCPQTVYQALYEIGDTIFLDGISVSKFLRLYAYTSPTSPFLTERGLISNDYSELDYYEAVKEIWGFPESKEFKIVVYNPANQDEYLDFPQKLKPPLETNVYSRYFNTFILSEDGLKIPVTVSMRIW